ncbi:MAG: DUF3160 domain-containing protein [Bacteroidales bacterium]|nr:DUF3160 domain-containing protein [Bacteroidales bacterium]
MKRLSISALCVMLAVSLVLFGCKSKDNKDGDAAKTEETVKTGDPNAPKLSFDCDLPTYISGCHVDIENMKDNVDLNMDISKLNLADLRILRNIFAAQQGYCFMDSFMRHIYSATSWYLERAIDKAWGDPVVVKYTPEQEKFIEKIKAREEELQKISYNPLEGYLVNYNNVTNIYQMEDAENEFKDLISKNGFAIIEGLDEQLFHIYEKNDYHDFPSFVTTDMYLQLYHMYFDFLLRDLEKTKLMGELKNMATTMHSEMLKIAKSSSDPVMKDAAEFNATFYAIGLSLLTDNKNYEVPAKYKNYFDIEIGNVNKASDNFSEFLGFEDVEFPYSLFRPRGHYTRDDEFKRYFKSMMWFQYVPFCLDDDIQFGRAVLNADVIKKNNSLQNVYKGITEPITFIVGEPDNVSIMQLSQEMAKSNLTAEKIMGNSSEMKKFRSTIKKIADQQNRISPKQAISCVDKINLMPQRYLADNEILQELVDVTTEPITMRALPKGLDVMAAFGSDDAYKILIDEYQEDKKWSDYVTEFEKVKKTMKNVNWDATMYNKWMQSLNTLMEKDSRHPYFMKTFQWAKKNLNAALASWSELKHDCILYGEQPMGAECGGGEDLPEPIVVGYVEPNLAYWNKALELLDMTENVLKTNGMLTAKAKDITDNMREKAKFLKSVSEKELAGKKLTENEYNQIEYIGSSFEWLTLDMLNAGAENPIYDWFEVQGADRKVAVVADIYTANSGNNPDKSILYAATGNVNTIYVIVEIEGKLWLTRGAVLSYREFDVPLGNPRLTDEEWQDMLKKAPGYGVPEWIKELVAPGKLPKDNEIIFYSSGC